ncbi:hypothetical protein HYV11_03890 [Candidatus Dependentiae bacterium]|nr:hypothetical protein [Candidatus Dependentiae bacterium]
MKKFITSLALSASILFILPACSKKIKKEEPVSLEQNQPTPEVKETSKEDFSF